MELQALVFTMNHFHALGLKLQVSEFNQHESQTSVSCHYHYLDLVHDHHQQHLDLRSPGIVQNSSHRTNLTH